MKLGAALVLLLLATATAPAAADQRSMFVNLGGTAGIGRPATGETEWGAEAEHEGVLIGRLFASWELPPLPYKEPRGYAFRGGVAPEVMIGRLRVADHRSGDRDDNAANFVAIGGRLEVAMSQRRMGLLEVSARGGFYLAGRVGLLDDEHRTPLVEAVLGEYIYLGDTARIGFEVGFLGLVSQQEQPEWAIRPTARGPWLDYSGDYHSFVATAYLGVKI